MFGFQSRTRDYLLRMPKDTAVLTACEDAGCQAWRHGWETYIDESTRLGRRQAEYIRLHSRRDFTEQRTAAGVTVFRFSPGQRCFAEHRTRPARLLVAEAGQVREHVSMRDWVDDFGEHMGRLDDIRKRG